jgi:hypothetical protein
MCEIATAMVIAGGLSTAMSAAGAIQSGQYQSAQASYQAQVQRNNAILQDNNSRTAILAGDEQALQAGRRSAAIIGAQRAAFAAGGVDPNTGSAADVQDSQAGKGELDQLTIRNNAARQAYGFDVAATSDRAQAELGDANAGMLSTAGTMQGFGSLLSGVSSVGSNWWRMQQGKPA